MHRIKGQEVQAHESLNPCDSHPSDSPGRILGGCTLLDSLEVFLMPDPTKRAWLLACGVIGSLFFLMTALLVFQVHETCIGKTFNAPEWFTAICSSAISSVLTLVSYQTLAAIDKHEKQQITKQEDAEDSDHHK